MQKLTDTAIRNMKPQAKRYKVFDGGGLHIEVMPTGAKFWRIKYRWNGKENRLTIGAYPGMTLKMAREALAEAKKKMEDGLDPAEEKRLVSRHGGTETGGTFGEVALEWAEKQRPRWDPGYYDAILIRLNRHILPYIGEQQIDQIPPTIVLRLLRLLENAGKLEMAYRVLGICSNVFRYGVACSLCPSDPCRDLRGALTSKVETPRAALTDPDDVGGLLASIDGYTGGMVMRAALYWSAYTFCRPGEVRRAEWSEIHWDKKEWRIPAAKMKMRREHRVPLARQCMAILGDLREYKLSEQWVFPSVRPSRPLSENGVLSALRRMDYSKEEMTAHGFRTTASTLLNELGYNRDWIERQLAHEDNNQIRAIYNRAEYMDERRVMMQEWADYLDSLRDKKLGV